MQYIAGGATQNAIRVAQWMIQVRWQCAALPCVRACGVSFSRTRGLRILSHTRSYALTSVVAHAHDQSPKATGFFGCIGKDAFGNELKECAKADGVDAFYKEDEAEATGALVSV